MRTGAAGARGPDGGTPDAGADDDPPVPTDLPAWAEHFLPDRLRSVPGLPLGTDAAEWAWGGSDGSGTVVAVVDTGIEPDHPLVGPVQRSLRVAPGESDDEHPYGGRVEECEPGDVAGHGTACAGIVRALAPGCELISVRVLGASMRGRSGAVAEGLRWCVENGVDVVNLSLSTANEAWFSPFHELVDHAFFSGTTVVCAVNNVPAPTYPSEFAAVLSVATGGGPGSPLRYNVTPPAEFGAPGLDVRVAWPGGGSVEVTGNSFAAAHVSGLAALVRAKHPGLPPAAVKAVLMAASENAVPV